MKFTASTIFIFLLASMASAQGPDRFSCSCIKDGEAVPFSSPICNGMGGALDGTSCNGLKTKAVSQDCDALIEPGSTALCVKTS